MASCYTSLALLFLCVSSLWAFNLQTCKGRRFSFDVHHRFSDHVKKWVAENGGDSYVAGDWPQRGSVDYYSALAHHDRTFRGRGLLDNDPDRTLTFSDGNATLKIASLGFLHYTAVTLGTPNVTFLVALDTGSDLFWVPCECISCAPTSSSRYQIDVELSIYSLNSSSTSKKLPCNNSLCDVKKECYEGGSSCPYEVAYVSADTSSSGILVEDIMYLTTEDSNHEIIRAPIVFGCGRIQTGSFLDVAAPNGLFGLGMEKISVPSILSASGLTTNSFSMCFGQNGIGRITFGDKGTLDQDETPFNIRQTHPTYNISVTGIRVGANLIDIGFYAVIDSGTSFTYLADPEYTLLCESFHSQALDSRQSPDSRIPFEYCYSTSPSQNASMIPGVSLTMKGGAQYSVNEPVVVISIQEELVYCLGVIKSPNLNIIGQNFMTGNRIVFDRERYILGWKRYDCYETDDSSSLPVNPRNNNTAEPPSVVVGHDPYTPEATKETGGGGTQVSEVPHLVSHSNPMWKSCFRQNNFLLLLFILCLVIL